MSGSAHHQYSVSDGIVSYFSSPSESFNAHQCWSPMPQGGGDFAAAGALPGILILIFGFDLMAYSVFRVEVIQT
jgi:hypothetical protein